MAENPWPHFNRLCKSYYVIHLARKSYKFTSSHYTCCRSLKSVKRLQNTNFIAAFYQLQLCNVSPKPTKTSISTYNISPLLQEFSVLFQKPNALPPVRSTSHYTILHLLLPQLMLNHIVIPISKSKKWKN